MAVDMKNFEQQIQNLETLRKAIDGAIEKARDRLDRIQNKNESFETVFETDRVPYGPSDNGG
jgi:hypothetical protein